MTASINSKPLSPVRQPSLLEPPLSPCAVRDFELCKPSRAYNGKGVRFVQRVRFAELAYVKETISRKDMTREEKRNYWLKDCDYSQIRKRNRELIAEMRAKKNGGRNTSEAKSDDICFRGLESGMPSVSQRKRAFRDSAAQEVFIEQEDQYFAGFYDDEALAAVYYHVASQCQFSALVLAIQDRKDADECHQVS